MKNYEALNLYSKESNSSQGIAFNSDCVMKKIASIIISRHRAEKYRKKTEI